MKNNIKKIVKFLAYVCIIAQHSEFYGNPPCAIGVGIYTINGHVGRELNVNLNQFVENGPSCGKVDSFRILETQGNIPAGIEFDLPFIRGIPMTPTSSLALPRIRIRAENRHGGTTLELRLNITSPPGGSVAAPCWRAGGVTLTENLTVVEGQPINIDLRSKLFLGGTCGEPQSWALHSGSLPQGLQFDPVRAVISGSVSVATKTSFQIIGRNGQGSVFYTLNLEVQYGLRGPGYVCPKRSINAVGITEILQATVGRSFRYDLNDELDLRGECGRGVEWTLQSGEIPPGLSLDRARGILEGTPQRHTEVGKPYDTFYIRVKGIRGRDIPMEVRIKISLQEGPPCVRINNILQGGRVGEAINLDLNSFLRPPTGACGSARLWRQYGALPPGLVLNPQTGLITGIPTQAIRGREVTFEALNTQGGVNLIIKFDISEKASGICIKSGAPLEIQLTAGKPMTPIRLRDYFFENDDCVLPEIWRVLDGRLPVGLQFDVEKGLITGVPTQLGQENMSIQALALSPHSQHIVLTLKIKVVSDDSRPCFIRPSDTIQFNTESPFTLDLNTYLSSSSSCGPGRSWEALDALPNGIELDPNRGRLTGRFTQALLNYRVRFLAHNYSNQPAEFALVFNVSSPSGLGDESNPPCIRTFNLPAPLITGTVGVPLEFSLEPYSLTGGVCGVIRRWEVVNGKLPEGLTIDQNTHRIMGTPRETSNAVVTLRPINASVLAGRPGPLLPFKVNISAPHIPCRIKPAELRLVVGDRTNVNLNDLLLDRNGGISCAIPERWQVLGVPLPQGLQIEQGRILTGIPLEETSRELHLFGQHPVASVHARLSIIVSQRRHCPREATLVTLTGRVGMPISLNLNDLIRQNPDCAPVTRWRIFGALPNGFPQFTQGQELKESVITATPTEPTHPGSSLITELIGDNLTLHTEPIRFQIVWRIEHRDPPICLKTREYFLELEKDKHALVDLNSLFLNGNSSCAHQAKWGLSPANPPLPEGLTLTADGQLTGTPSVIWTGRSYSLYVSNSTGSYPVNLRLSVKSSDEPLCVNQYYLEINTHVGKPEYFDLRSFFSHRSGCGRIRWWTFDPPEPGPGNRLVDGITFRDGVISGQAIRATKTPVRYVVKAGNEVDTRPIFISISVAETPSQSPRTMSTETCPDTLSPVRLPQATRGKSYTASIPLPSFQNCILREIPQLLRPLPPGLTFSVNFVDNQIYINGAPTEVGSFTAEFRIRRQNNLSPYNLPVTIIVGEDSSRRPCSFDSIAIQNIPKAELYKPYSHTLRLSTLDCIPIQEITLLSGQFPPGIAWRRVPEGILFEGTPAASGRFQSEFNLIPTTGSERLTQQIALEVVSSKPCPNNITIEHFRVGVPARYRIDDSQFITDPVTRVVTKCAEITQANVQQGQLPRGLELRNTVDGWYIQGVPLQSGDSTVVIRVTNSEGAANVTFNFRIRGESNPSLLPPCNRPEQQLPAATIRRDYNYVVSPGDPSSCGPIQEISLGFGALPPGLNLNFEDGRWEIEGVPSQIGQYRFVLQVRNTTGQANHTYSIQVVDAPPCDADTTAPIIRTINQPYRFNLINTQVSSQCGQPTQARLIQGNLPPGLQIIPRADGVYIEGTPNQSGTYPFTLAVANASGQATIRLIIRVEGAGQSTPALRPPCSVQTELTQGEIQIPYRFELAPILTLNGCGSADQVTLASGSLHAGLRLENGPNGWAIVGTPTEHGTRNFTLTLTNAAGRANALLTLTIRPSSFVIPPCTAKVSIPEGVVNQPYLFRLAETQSKHCGPIESAVLSSGSLHSGLRLERHSQGWVIVGTPTEAGVRNFVIIATNNGGSVNLELTLNVRPDPDTAPPCNAEAQEEALIDRIYRFDINAYRGGGVCGKPTEVQLTSGTLHNGLAIINQPPGLWRIEGYPRESGTRELVFSLRNQYGSSIVRLRLTVKNPPLGAPCNVDFDLRDIATLGQPFRYAIGDLFYSPTRGCGAAQRVTLTEGRLPNGINLASSNGTWVIEGTPTEAGEFRCVLIGTNDAGTGTLRLRLVVKPANTTGSVQPPPVSSGSPVCPNELIAPSGNVNNFYRYDLTAALPASCGPIRLITIQNGVLHNGLRLQNESGRWILSGTPIESGKRSFILSLFHISGSTTTLVLNLNILSPYNALSTTPTIVVSPSIPTGSTNTPNTIVSPGVTHTTLRPQTTPSSSTIFIPPCHYDPIVPDARVGVPYRLDIAATQPVGINCGPVERVSLHSGTLPSGLRLAQENGRWYLLGTPTQSGRPLIALTLSNSAGSALTAIRLNIQP